MSKRTILFILGATGIFAGMSMATLSAFTSTHQQKTPSYPSLPEQEQSQTASNIFISGHSLTDRPMPDFLSTFAARSGKPIWWNMQHLGGSSIRQRSLGTEGATPGSGFATGTDRNGQVQDVRAELQRPSTPDGKAYDILIVTEQHRILASLLWQDSIGSLRAFQDTFITANPAGLSYFFTPWIDISDKAKPADWIAYERETFPVWQCMVAAVNNRIATDGRKDALYIIPAAPALAELIAYLSDGPPKPGFEGLSRRDIVEAIFADTVHLTPLGNHYIAAITSLALDQRSLDGAPAPSQAAIRIKTLSNFAQSYMLTYRKQHASYGGQACSAGISLAYAAHYAAYIEKTYTRGEKGLIAAKIQQLDDTLRFAWRLRTVFDTNRQNITSRESPTAL